MAFPARLTPVTVLQQVHMDGAHCSRCWGQWIETHLLPKGPASSQSDSTVLASQPSKCPLAANVLFPWAG